MIKVENDSFLQTQFGPKASETISQRRCLPKLFICKRNIHHKGRKRFFPTVSIRSESVRNDFSEKVFVKIKMIHISILSYSLNLVRKRLKRFLQKVFVKITQFRVCLLSVSIDYTLLLGARCSCGQSTYNSSLEKNALREKFIRKSTFNSSLEYNVFALIMQELTQFCGF